MIKPPMPNMPNIPGFGAVSETLDFVKNLWGGMGLPGVGMPGMPSIPGMVMPTLSVEEINKKITDLKAVEAWLVLNMNMLRATIQALEVQAATISTLQTMGETFTATMTSGVKEKSGEHEQMAAGNGSDSADNASRGAAKPGTLEPTSKDEIDAATLTAPLVNAAAWWNMLQDQFKQAVSGAMAAEPPAAAGPQKEKPKAKSASTATGTGTARRRKTTK
ncbi:MAG TPA: PhaM family polyhydroxyalkanoate granule multifunctional regulatory protein [Noviherbaspirillum sp.]